MKKKKKKKLPKPPFLNLRRVQVVKGGNMWTVNFLPIPRKLRIKRTYQYDIRTYTRYVRTHDYATELKKLLGSLQTVIRQQSLSPATIKL